MPLMDSLLDNTAMEKLAELEHMVQETSTN